MSKVGRKRRGVKRNRVSGRLYKTVTNSIPEKKFVDNYITVNSGTTGFVKKTWIGFGANTANITNWKTIPAAVQNGSADYQRTGRKIFLTHISFEGCIMPTTDFTASATYGCNVIGEAMRLCFVHNKQTNGAELATSDVFQNTSGTDVAINSFRNGETLEKCSIVWDQKFVMSPGALGACCFKAYIPTKKTIAYDSNSGTISSLLKDSWDFMFIFQNDTSTGGHPCWNLTMTIKYHFIDV